MKTPRNIASVDMKNSGIEVRREVVSMAMVMEFRRIVAIIMPLKSGVCMERRKKTDSEIDRELAEMALWHVTQA